jgi:hypothetical protein
MTRRCIPFTLLATLGLQCLAQAGQPAPPAAKPAETPITTSATIAGEESVLTLRRNLSTLRQAMEQEQAQDETLTRLQPPLVALATGDPSSLASLRGNLGAALSKLDNRCIGVDAHVNGGNLILICGDNSGSASNANVQTTTGLPIAAADPGLAPGTSIPAQRPMSAGGSAP